MAKRDVRADVKIDPNVELEDYSGPFKPDLRYSDFSREKLARMYAMCTIYSCEQIMVLMDHITEKYGTEAMIETHQECWPKAAPHVSQILTKTMNMKGNDIESLMKCFQIDTPWGPVIFDITHELSPAKDRGVLTVWNCPGVELLEERGEAHLIRKFCVAVDQVSMTAYAKWFNPNILVKPLLLPDERGKDDPCCVWEFTYKSK